MSADEFAEKAQPIVETIKDATDQLLPPWKVPHEYVDNNGWCLTCGRSEAAPCHAEQPAEVSDEPQTADTAPLEFPEDDS